MELEELEQAAELTLAEQQQDHSKEDNSQQTEPADQLQQVCQAMQNKLTIGSEEDSDDSEESDDSSDSDDSSSSESEEKVGSLTGNQQ